MLTTCPHCFVSIDTEDRAVGAADEGLMPNEIEKHREAVPRHYLILRRRIRAMAMQPTPITPQIAIDAGSGA
jgi:hypothetical protein